MINKVLASLYESVSRTYDTVSGVWSKPANGEVSGTDDEEENSEGNESNEE